MSGPQSIQDAVRGIHKRQERINRRNRQIKDLKARVEFLVTQISRKDELLRDAKNYIQQTIYEWETEMNGHLPEDKKPKMMAYEISSLKIILSHLEKELAEGTEGK